MSLSSSSERPRAPWWRTLLVFAGAAWLTSSQVARAFDPRGDEGAMLLAEERATLHDPAREEATRASLRAVNPEWDLMRRMFVGLSLANEAERDSAHRAELLGDLDAVADGLLRDDERAGPQHFLLPYGSARPFVHPDPTTGGPRSIFVDGEIAVVLAARELVAPRPERSAALDARIARIEASMDADPSHSGESYPDEAWTFCNTTALAALALYDTARGTDHGRFARAWLGWAKAHLIEPATGLLVSSYELDGTWRDRAEGSTIFQVAHNLLLWDDAFARDQWARARRALVFDVAGFTLAREWPNAAPDAQVDVDSGPIVPLLDASPGASGFAVLASVAFGDDGAKRGLMRSLDFAAFPQRTPTGMRFAGASAMGDAVLGYGLGFGPIWDKVRSARTLRAQAGGAR
jgi:hypothetical protein